MRKASKIHLVFHEVHNLSDFVVSDKYANCYFFIVLYDISEKLSFVAIESFLLKIEKLKPKSHKLVIGMKSDL